ncbi:MAG: OsmC family protein [Actinobacteria bacterium]|nr:OsmC family protein [Actinomycetota bacterium]
MHNVNTDAVAATAAAAAASPEAVLQPVVLSGEWQVSDSEPQFTAMIPYPGGQVEFRCDFPAPMGGGGRAPNPLAYCMWGGVACYAMSFALEAAREGVPLRALRGEVSTTVDMSRALGVSDRPPVEKLTWTLHVDCDADPATLDRLKSLADDRCPGAYCISNPIPLETRLG